VRPLKEEPRLKRLPLLMAAILLMLGVGGLAIAGAAPALAASPAHAQARESCTPAQHGDYKTQNGRVYVCYCRVVKKTIVVCDWLDNGPAAKSTRIEIRKRDYRVTSASTAKLSFGPGRRDVSFEHWLHIYKGATNTPKKLGAGELKTTTTLWYKPVVRERTGRWLECTTSRSATSQKGSSTLHVGLKLGWDAIAKSCNPRSNSLELEFRSAVIYRGKTIGTNILPVGIIARPLWGNDR
jgi:hypothetical protein